MARKRIIIDCDPGVDDLIALVYAFNHPEVEVVAVSSVSGNVGIDVTTRNLEYLLPYLSHKKIPLIRGYEQPLKRQVKTADYVHGQDGLGGQFSFFESQTPQKAKSGDCATHLFHIISQESNPITIVALGPLTNMARLLTLYPQVREKIEAIYVMGGGLGYGNITPYAEFNFYVDPEAVEIVLAAKVPIHLISLNLTSQAMITSDLLEKLYQMDEAFVTFCAKALDRYAQEDALLHDPVTLMALTDAHAFKTKPRKVAVKLSTDDTRGQIVEDDKGYAIIFYETMDPSYFKEAIIRTFKTYCLSKSPSIYSKVFAITESIFNEPELGYKEFKTKQKVIDFMSQYQVASLQAFSTTGLRYRLNDTFEKTLGIVIELDAVYAPNHFKADLQSGAAHNCGHFSQVGVALALTDLLLGQKQWIKQVAYNIELIFVPAEEYLDLDFRRQLKANGQIKFFGGKQEAIHLGVFDQLDLALCIHSISKPCIKNTVEINCDLVGFLYKYFAFKGKPSHAGFDPFSGVNAYQISTLFNTAIGLMRQQFSDQQYVRINPIVMEAQMTTNIVPDFIKIGSDIRTKSTDYMLALSQKLDQAAIGCSMALEGHVDIETEMGYLPFIQSRLMNALVFESYQKTSLVEDIITDRGTSAAAGDIGDLSFLVPTIQIGYSGFEGTIHGTDFKMTNPRFVLSDFPQFLLECLVTFNDSFESLCTYKKTKDEYLILMEKLSSGMQ